MDRSNGRDLRESRRGHDTAASGLLRRYRLREQVRLRTSSGIVAIEGKRTEADVTTCTTWMPVRHQMLRHLDGAWDLRDDHRVVGLFIVEGDGGREASTVPGHWIERCVTTVQREVLEASLPHRADAERSAIAAGYLGVTTWQAVCDALGVSYDGLPDRL
jgi:hypothetical protein